MNKKPIYWTCAVIMVLAFGWGVADRFILARQTEYVITRFTALDVFAARPLFYACLALVFAIRMFRPLKPWLQYTLLALGIALSLLLCGVAVASILDVAFTIPFFGILRGLFQYNILFLIPGALLGLGLNRD